MLIVLIHPFVLCKLIFAVCLHNCINHFFVIGLVETWLKDQTLELVNIPGYNFVSNHRRDKTGGYSRNVYEMIGLIY
jgi:hypothetical protein